MPDYRIISADDHVFEPGDLWTSGIEPKFRDRAPHIARVDDGDFWVCDDYKGIGAFAGSQPGRRFDAPEKLTNAELIENVRPGGYIPEEHVKDMDLDGVDVSIVYPTAGLQMYSLRDGELLSAIFRTYNDWVAEFCSASPRRLKGVAMLNIDDVEEGVTELERCAQMGLVGALIPVYAPLERPYMSPEYEPLWAAAQDLEIPLSLHINTIRPGGPEELHNVTSLRLRATYFCNADFWVRTSLGDMIFGGVFERYPKLRVGSIEMETSWVPHFLFRLDFQYTQMPQRATSIRFEKEMVPSDYFHRNAFLGFSEEPMGIQLREVIGVDNLLWGADYPHPESTFPRSQEILERILAECSEEEKAQIVGGNAARIYHLD